MDTREFKGLELAAKAKIEHRKTYWYVPSATKQGGHRVENDCSECSCEDFELRQLPCKHIFAVRIVKERNRGTPVTTSPVSDRGMSIATSAVVSGARAPSAARSIASDHAAPSTRAARSLD